MTMIGLQGPEDKDYKREKKIKREKAQSRQ